MKTSSLDADPSRTQYERPGAVKLHNNYQASYDKPCNRKHNKILQQLTLFFLFFFQTIATTVYDNPASSPDVCLSAEYRPPRHMQ